MRVLVTGGAGFIGSHIVETYVEHGFDVEVIDNLSTGSIDNIKPGIPLHKMDIRDPEVPGMIKDGKFDIINHQAAQINLRTSVEEPEYDIDVNILGSLNLIKGAKDAGVGYMIFASSGGAVYGFQDYYPADEKHPCNPTSPYGINKFTIEKYLYFYQIQTGLKWCALRYSNVYGPRQNPKCEAGVVSIFTNALLTGEESYIFGNGKQSRDFVFVEDVARANLMAAQQRPVGAYNICTSLETDIITIYDIISRHAGKEREKQHKPAIQGEIKRSLLDYSKAKETFGWSAQTSLEDGLKLSVEHFKQKLHHE